MATFGKEPCPVMLAKQRARAAMGFATIGFVAVGAVAWIALEAVRMSSEPSAVYASAPQEDTADQLVMALKAPREHENDRARLGLLEDSDGPMLVIPLDSLVELAQIDRAPSEPDVKIAQAPKAEPTPELALAAVAPERTPLPAFETPPEIAEAPEAIAEPEPAEEIIVASENCIGDLRDLAQAHKIQFEFDSADLEGSELPALQKIGRLAMACPEAMIHVTGHSDSIGTDIVNLALSWQRADNTVAALAALGIDTAQFEPVGFGARSPTSQGDSSDEELNRRVEFVVLQPVGG